MHRKMSVCSENISEENPELFATSCNYVVFVIIETLKSTNVKKLYEKKHKFSFQHYSVLL